MTHSTSSVPITCTPSTLAPSVIVFFIFSTSVRKYFISQFLCCKASTKMSHFKGPEVPHLHFRSATATSVLKLLTIYGQET